jgi:hypothetical protein
VAEIRSLWGDGKDPELSSRARALLETMLKSATPDEPWIAQLISDGKPARELYRDPDHGFILKGHIHPRGRGSSPHDHGPYWVLYGVYQGEIEIAKYRRTDDGSLPGKASLEKIESARLTPGVVKPYLRGDIHDTKAIAASVVFRFLSGDVDAIKRHRYNLEHGTVTVE